MLPERALVRIFSQSSVGLSQSHRRGFVARLVVTGSDYAKFKGVGTINGEGEYKFQIWAGDSSPDTFRIKIWTEDDAGVETVVYDNGFDQPIGGGSIKVHSK